MGHTALCGMDGRARTSPVQTHCPRGHHWAETQKSWDSLRRTFPTHKAGKTPGTLNHAPPSDARRETEAQAEAGPLPIYITTFLSLVFVLFLTTLLYFLPLGHFFPRDPTPFSI